MKCRLRILMAEKDPPLSQKLLALETGLSPTTVNQLYGNKFKLVAVSTVETLCEYFGVGIGDLFSMEEIVEDDREENDEA